MAMVCEKVGLITFVLKPCQNQGVAKTLAHSVACPSHLHKNPMFRTSFFKKEDLRDIGIQIGGKRGGLGVEGRGIEGVILYVPLLPPQKHELDLSTSDGQSWALLTFNQLAPFFYGDVEDAGKCDG